MTYGSDHLRVAVAVRVQAIQDRVLRTISTVPAKPPLGPAHRDLLQTQFGSAIKELEEAHAPYHVLITA